MRIRVNGLDIASTPVFKLKQDGYFAFLCDLSVSVVGNSIKVTPSYRPILKVQRGDGYLWLSINDTQIYLSRGKINVWKNSMQCGPWRDDETGMS